MTDSLTPSPAPATALVPVKLRHDGWTPEKQRGFIEHLADTGCVKDAAGRVGMSESSAYRLRRRSGAAAFDAAWEAALEKGLERLTSMAVERAINGSVKRIWYHGELIAEERVYSDRLLMYLMQRGRDALGRAAGRRKIASDWDGAMDGLAREAIAGEPVGGFRVWRDREGVVLTNFPPPARFTGYEEGAYGHPKYCRTLTDAEEKIERAREQAVQADARAARARHFSAAGASGGNGRARR